MKVSKWQIIRANLDPVIGSEQGKSRPVLIISENDINELLNIVNVLPVATRKEQRTIYPNEVKLEVAKYGLPNESIVLCHQIRTIDKKRLSITYGAIDDTDKQNEVNTAICFQLGIDR